MEEQPEEGLSEIVSSNDAATTTNTTTKTATTRTNLERSFVYQNGKTGSVSTSALTTRQLCRILCPPNTNSSANVSTSVIRPESLVLAFDASTGTYSSEGWKTLNSFPILKDCCTQWYYYHDSGSNEQQQSVQGPVSCRSLQLLLGKGSIQLDTKVCSTEPQQQQWYPLQELDDLRMAMDAFDTAPPPWLMDTTDTSSKHNINDNGNGNNEKVVASLSSSNSQEYDASVMTFQSDDGVSASQPSFLATESNIDSSIPKGVKDELEAFLSSTAAGLGPNEVTTQRTRAANHDKEEEEEGYESDGGTPYVKCKKSGTYIHAALAPPCDKNVITLPPQVLTQTKQPATSLVGKKQKNKPKFSAKHAKNWVYITGLPTDCTLDELITVFSKAGIIDLDPETQSPKVKLYQEKTKKGSAATLGTLKGDASICYARPESVELAMTLLDESPFRYYDPSSSKDQPQLMRVQRAKFEQHGSTFQTDRAGGSKHNVSNKKRQVARLAALQAVDWDEGDNGRISGGRKGLRIIVLKHMFHPEDWQENTSAPNSTTASATREEQEHAALAQLEQEIRSECQEWGTVEKITMFSKHPSGVVIVKFTQPSAASTAVKEYDGRRRPQGNGNALVVHASFWDGVTDYTVRDEEKEQEETNKRNEDFGNWLNNQELPEEFRLKVSEEPDGDNMT